jgi:glycosyltransferase involved in cell wall biosynthesis
VGTRFGASLSHGVVDVELSPDGRAHGERVDITGPALVIARDSGVPVGSAFVPPGVTAAGPLDDVVEWRHGDVLAPAAPEPVSVTVAVCTRNRPELLERCLRAIQRAVAVAGVEVDVSILVVDNASDDERPAEMARSLGVEVAREPVPGLDVARNRAVAASRGDVVAFVDDDVVVDPTWLRTLARTFGRHPEAVAVTGGVLAYSLATEAQAMFEGCGGFFKGWRAGPLEAAMRRDLPFDPSIGVGCNMAFRRRALVAAGPFDEALDTGAPLAGGGDLDMLLRMAKLGTVVYEPAAMARHEHRSSLDALAAQYRSWGLSWGAVLHKWYRRSPGDRRLIRRVVRRTLRWYGHDLILPRSPGRLRHRDAWRLLVGFVVGATTAYPRSQRRMAARRARAT